MKKKTLSLALAFVVLFTAFFQCVLLQNNKVYANTSNLKVGDYVSFGNYNGQSILWKIINLDSQGDPLLFADQILSFKAFDGSTATGSSKWETSHLRKWLNSDEGKVSFGVQEPNATAVYKGLNAYHNEAGFLTNFTADERQIIKTTTNKILLTNESQSEKTGGSELHTGVFDLKANGAVANYENSFYKNVQDKVFLLSIKELKEYVADRGYAVEAKATTNALSKEESEFGKGSNAEAVENYWLRTPTVTKGSEKPSDAVRIVTNKGDILDGCAYYGMIGVRPALTLQSVEIQSGLGTSHDPYKVKKKPSVAEELKISIGNGQGKLGDIVSIPVTLSDVGTKGIAAFDLWLEYDTSLLEYQGIKNSINGLEIHPVENQIRTGFYNVNPIFDGPIFTLQFKVKTKSPSLAEIKVLQKNETNYEVGFYGLNDEKYPFTYTGGSVKIESSSGLEGDIDEDGEINSSDVLRIIHFALGKEKPTETQLTNADMNKDGKINVMDALSLVKRILSSK